MKRWLLIGAVSFVMWCLVPATLFSATYDLTGNWNYQLSDNWAYGGINCEPGPAASGTCVIEQSGDTFVFAFLTGVECSPPESCTFAGTVIGATYCCNTTDIVDDEGGSVTSSLAFTATSNSAASGTGGSKYTHPSGLWECYWGSNITLSRSPGAGPQKVTVNGTVTYNGNPECTMVLVNGQYAFTCDGSGEYELIVPLDPQGKITVQAFCRGLAPYRQAFTPSGLEVTHEVAMVKETNPSMSVTVDTAKISPAKARVHGTVTYNGFPVCAMVLINGKYMFTSETSGIYDLNVHLDSQGQATIQVFCANLAPYRQVVTPE